MDELPDLESLNVGEKDQLIRELWSLRALVRDLAAQVTALQLKVTEHQVLATPCVRGKI